MRWGGWLKAHRYSPDRLVALEARLRIELFVVTEVEDYGRLTNHCSVVQGGTDGIDPALERTKCSPGTEVTPVSWR
jgi:hypothetical protein